MLRAMFGSVFHGLGTLAGRKEMPSLWRLLCSWSSTDSDFGEHTNSTHPAAFQKRPSPAVLTPYSGKTSLWSQWWNLFYLVDNKSGVSSIDLQGMGRNCRDGCKQWASRDVPLMGWILPCPSHAETQLVFIRQLFSLHWCFPWAPFFSRSPPALPSPRQQSLITPLLMFAVSFLAVSFAPWNSQQDSHTGTLGGRLGLLAWLERRLCLFS